MRGVRELVPALSGEEKKKDGGGRINRESRLKGRASGFLTNGKEIRARLGGKVGE